MEKAYRASGELTTDVGPFDVGLERFVVSENRDFLGRAAVDCRQACFGIAGPVQRGRVATTNLPWVVSEKKLQKYYCKA